MSQLTVSIPPQLRTLTGGLGVVELSGSSTVRFALEELESLYPGIKGRIIDGQGDLRRFVNLFVDGEDVRNRDGLDTSVAQCRELTILPAIAGG